MLFGDKIRNVRSSVNKILLLSGRTVISLIYQNSEITKAQVQTLGYSVFDHYMLRLRIQDLNKL